MCKNNPIFKPRTNNKDASGIFLEQTEHFYRSDIFNCVIDFSSSIKLNIRKHFLSDRFNFPESSPTHPNGANLQNSL